MARVIRSLLSDVRARFLIAGGSAALLAWLLRLPLGCWLSYSGAVLLAQAAGMACGFVIYREWVFTERADRPFLNQIVDFLLVNLAGASVTVAVALAVNAMVGPLLAQPMLAEALAHAVGIAAGAVANFLGHKHATFRCRPAVGGSA